MILILLPQYQSFTDLVTVDYGNTKITLNAIKLVETKVLDLELDLEYSESDSEC